MLNRLPRLAIALLGCTVFLSAGLATPSLLLVVGASGEEDFGKYFSDWAVVWKDAAEKAGATLKVIGLQTNSPAPDRQQLQAALESFPKESADELWVICIGHGTFDGREAKFNLRGPDVGASEVRTWLQPFRRPLAVINAASASSPFINALSGTNRVLITATRSGQEQNFARFGGFLAKAVTDPAADLDKDGQTSLLEAYLIASRQTQDFYKTEGRLATEHALLDDNGDGLGTPADWFKGIRAVKKPRDGATMDGLRAHQFHLVRSSAERDLPSELRAKRDAIELQIAQLRDGKDPAREDEYYAKLEKLLLELATVYKPTAKQ